MCAIRLVNENKAKDAKKERVAMRRKSRDNDVKYQKEKAQIAFNRFIRARDRKWYIDRGQPPECISCGTTNPSIQYAAGHYKTRGAHPELALDEENCHLQCNKRCNKELSGNINGTKTTRGYLAGMVARHGEDKARAILERLDGPHEPKKYTASELKEKAKYYNAKARKIEQSCN
jgi:hypothetical protein